MTRTWCMRYEAKHSYFKRLAAYMGNFTNVAFTLADPHQANNCYVSCASNGEVTNNVFHSDDTIVGEYLIFCLNFYILVDDVQLTGGFRS